MVNTDLHSRPEAAAHSGTERPRRALVGRAGAGPLLTTWLQLGAQTRSPRYALVEPSPS